MLNIVKPIQDMGDDPLGLHIATNQVAQILARRRIHAVIACTGIDVFTQLIRQG